MQWRHCTEPANRMRTELHSWLQAASVSKLHGYLTMTSYGLTDVSFQWQYEFSYSAGNKKLPLHQRVAVVVLKGFRWLLRPQIAAVRADRRHRNRRWPLGIERNLKPRYVSCYWLQLASVLPKSMRAAMVGSERNRIRLVYDTIGTLLAVLYRVWEVSLFRR